MPQVSGYGLYWIDKVQFVIQAMQYQKDNASSLETEFEQELSRVMIHGVLHLMSYNDKTPEEQATMRVKEDFYLALQAKN